MNPLDNNTNSDVAKFFKNLGYEYSWDFSKRDGLHWHEIYEGNRLILQVEMVPLKQIVEDMAIEEEIEVDYFLAGEDTEAYIRLCKTVREYVKENPEWYKKL